MQYFKPVPLPQAAAHYQTAPNEVFVKRYPYDNWSPTRGNPTDYPASVRFALGVKLGTTRNALNEVLVND